MKPLRPLSHARTLRTLTALYLLLTMANLVHSAEHVVLLHGLARSSTSMNKMEQALTAEGYIVHNLDYPSRSEAIEAIAHKLRPEIVSRTTDADRVHFVTHSMGGIIVREVQKTEAIQNIGRVVMLSPPNNGSEVVDRIGHLSPFKWLNGPAGQQLGTAPDGFVQHLGPVDFELAVITGDRSINWILSTMIPGKDDGKVSLESAKVEGMSAYKVIHATHPFIMRNKEAIAATKAFLKSGSLTEK